MVSACLDAGIHYIDVTGEIDVFDAVFARHDDAVAAGVVLLPGAGFDVVPTDCVAATLFEALPTATTLEEVRDPSGASVTMTLTGPNPYDLTADSVVEAVRRLLAGTVAPGAHTPVTAFGPTYAGTLTGVTLSTPTVSTPA